MKYFVRELTVVGQVLYYVKETNNIHEYPMQDV